MSDKLYLNYYKEGNVGPVREGGLLLKIRRAVVNKYFVISKSINRSIRRAGNYAFTSKLLDRKIPKIYRRAAKEPVDENKVVFVEIRHPRITNSFEVVFDELTNNYDYNIHCHFLLNSNTIRSDYAKRVVNAVQDIATAKYVFLNEGSNAISAMPLRPETKIIQLWHGCGAFKKFGFSTADLIFGANRREQLRHPFNKNYSLVTVSSPEVVWAFKEAMNMPEKSTVVQPTGSSRTDVFYDDEFINAAFENVYHQVPQARGKKVILYAPTFRGRVARAKTPNMLNIKMFYDNLGDDYVLLFKHHPVVKSRPKIDNEYADFAVDVTDTLSIEDLLCVSDICISDYSSLVFEYSLFEKPLIFFAYDLDDYFDWRGFYYDYFELAPGLIAKTNYEMIDYIQHIDERFDKQAIKDFRYKFMRSCDGHATERILEYAFEGLEEHRKPCEKREHYYMVPKVESSLLPYFKRLAAIAETKEYAAPLYNEIVKNTPIKEGSIVAFDIHSKEILYQLKKEKSKKLTVVESGESIENVVEAIANANYILIDQPNTFLDSLDMREETKVILLLENAFPLEAVGKLTKEYRSGLRKEQYEIAPFLKNVSSVVCASDETAALLKTAIGDGIETLVLGDIRADAFKDRHYKVEILEEFYKRHPEFEGKRLIAYFGKNREEDMIDKSLIYEYLCRNSIVLTCYDNYIPTDEYTPVPVNYYSDGIYDVTEEMSRYDLLIIADIVIGGFKSYLYSYMVTGKPIIVYSDDIKNDIPNTESFMDLTENTPSPICENAEEIIKIALDYKNYDYKKYNELRDKYLTLCDGETTKRLFEALK